MADFIEAPPLKKTCLHSRHLALSARMVDFAGWSMPLSYQSQIIEHQEVRENAGMFDVSHMQVVDLKGSQVHDFMSYLIANDINKISKNQAIYSAMLNEEGGIIDDLITYIVDDDFIRLVVNSGCAKKDIAWIEKQASNFAVDVNTSKKLAIVAIQGPNATEYSINFLKKNYPQMADDAASLKPFYFCYSKDFMIAKTGYTGESGFECILSFAAAHKLWDELLESGVVPCGLASRDSLRLEAGYPLYGHDLNEANSPLVSGLSWCTSLNTDRKFIGKDATLEIKNQGGKYKLLGIVLKDKGVIRDNQVVITSAGKGMITSGGYSPTLKQSIALARLPKNATGECKIEIRNRLLKAMITPAAFVRNGKILVDLN